MKKYKIKRPTRILFVVTFIASMVFTLMSPFMYNIASDQAYAYSRELRDKNTGYFLESQDIMQTTMKLSLQTYIFYLNETLPEDERPKFMSDNLLVDYKKQDKEKRTEFNDAINSTIYSHQYDLQYLKYYISDREDHNKVYTNDSSLPERLDTHHDWYVAFQINENGEFKLTKTNTTIAAEDIELSFQNATTNALSTMTDLKLKEIKNTTFIFMYATSSLPLLSGNVVEVDQNIFYHYKVSQFVCGYFIVMALLSLLIVFLPYGALKKSKLVEKATTKKGAILLAAWFVSINIFILTNAAGLLQRSSVSELFFLIVFFSVIYMVAFLPVALIICLLKKCYYKKLNKAPKEDSTLYHILSVFDAKCSCFYHYITEIDVSTLFKKKIILLSLLNCIIVVFMVVICPILLSNGFNIVNAPIICLILYSGVIYILLYKYFKKQKKDYDELEGVIKRLSQGEFDQEVKEDLGMFHAMKGNIEHLQTGFQEAVEQEVHSQQMKTELITNVSHDLKTPLTSMISYIDLLKDESLDEKTRQKYINILDSSSYRLKHLIENLFDISKANSGNVSLDYMDVDIISLLQQVETECEVLLKKKHLTLRYTIPEEKVILSLDPQKAFRIFENLIGNVGKYAMPKTRVYINVEDYGNMVEISIKNISSCELDFDPEEIMERFTRGDKSRNSEGSGLGLAIAKSFSELLHGNMKISIDGDLFKVIVRFYRQEEEE